ncbi:hypothetical protein JCGZ_17303 [Jatropha curcas]|uniref:Uncharacterized protein n=1 Tax=Jatropha curcas TaxID=180498 RepID=A0A067LB53_JATCU|nr:hypothetical protein JCGZ_17303 [Jatropha curcas]
MPLLVRSEVKEVVVEETASEKIRSQTPAKDNCRRKNEETGVVALLSRSERNRSSLRLLCQQVSGNREEECEAAPSFRPPRVAGEPRRILRRGSDRGKVAALPVTVAFARNERREGRGGRTCCGEEALVVVARALALAEKMGKEKKKNVLPLGKEEKKRKKKKERKIWSFYTIPVDSNRFGLIQ